MISRCRSQRAAVALSLSLSLSLVALVGCSSAVPPKEAPPPTPAPAPAEPAPVVQRFAEPATPAPAFDDPGRKERVLSAMGELDAMLRDAQEAPGRGFHALAAGVVLGGDLVWSRGYGQRTGDGGAVDETTVFRIGSITKVFTGMAALRLRDEGKLDLDRPAHDYLRALGGVVYTATDERPITVRQLLTHTSGLARDLHVHVPEGETMTRERAVGGLDGLLLQTSPLETLRYSNFGVGLVGLIAGDRANKPYRELIEGTILEPLGMTGYWDAAAVPADRLASGHDHTGKAISLGEHSVIGATEGSGGLYTSLADMARFTALHLAAWPARGDADPHAGVLRRSSLRESHTMARFGGMSAKTKDDGETSAEANGVGIAWQVQQSCELEHLVWHNGATRGYSAALFMLPRLGVGVILLSSTNRSVTGLAHDALRHIVKTAELRPRRPRPSPALEAIVNGPVTRFFAEGALPPSEFEATFGVGFRHAVPLPRMTAIHEGIKKDNGVCKVARYLEVPAPSDAWIELACDGGARFALWVRLDLANPQRVAGYLVKPLASYQKEPETPRCPQEPAPPKEAPDAS